MKFLSKHLPHHAVAATEVAIPRRAPRRHARFAALVVLFVCSSDPSCSAAVSTWTGAGTIAAPTGGLFSNPGNWEGDVFPTFDQTTDVVFEVGTSGYTATNDIGALAVNSLRLTHDGTSASELWLANGAFTFHADGAENPQLSVSSTGSAVRIGSDLVLGADLSLIRAAPQSDEFLFIGSGIAGGNINLGPHTLHVSRTTRPPGLAAERIRIGEPGSTTRGVIQGTGRIVLDDAALQAGPSDFTLHLSSQNTYSGGTEVRRGHLALNGPAILANGAVLSGPVGTGPVLMYGGILRSTVSRRALQNDLVVNGSFQLGSSSFQAIVVAGPVRLNGSYTIGVAGNGFGTEQGVVEVSGPISETTPGTGLTWNLAQPLKLTSICTYTGPTLIRGNILQLSAPGSLRDSPLTLDSNGGLSGDGETGSVTAGTNATVSPGVGVGILGTIGPVQLNAGSRLALEINSPIAGLGYDQWDVQGAFALTQVDLQIALGYDPVDFADIFFLVSNDGVDAISGAFASVNGIPANLSEGARFFVADQEFEISYTAEESVGFAGSGNDIAIRALPEPSTAALLAFCGLGALTRRARQPNH